MSSVDADGSGGHHWAEGCTVKVSYKVWFGVHLVDIVKCGGRRDKCTIFVWLPKIVSIFCRRGQDRDRWQRQSGFSLFSDNSVFLLQERMGQGQVTATDQDSRAWWWYCMSQ